MTKIHLVNSTCLKGKMLYLDFDLSEIEMYLSQSGRRVVLVFSLTLQYMYNSQTCVYPANTDKFLPIILPITFSIKQKAAQH